MARRRRDTLKSKVAKLEKKINYISPNKSFELTSDNGSFARNFNGVVDTLGISNCAGISTYLTSLAEGTGLQKRKDIAVQINSLKGHLIMKLPETSSFVAGGVAEFRAIILHVKTLLTNDAGTYVEPTLAEALGTNTTTTVSDMYTDLSVVQLNTVPAKRNYRIVYDKRFTLSVTPAGGSQGASYTCHWNIKPKKGQKTTYTAITNTSDACVSNHYILYVFGTNSQVVNNIALYRLWSTQCFQDS